ncbi:hypothetical protein [Streptomyces sp. CAU 1734]|uniref:hypothetical protein n=1 Tax=Streptomyces sp. CAU 1734 TaxID=3140360 RepID=UPI0032614D87
MTRSDASGVFALIEGALQAVPDSVRRPLTVTVEHLPVELSPEECREVLYGARRDEVLRTAIWRQAVTEVRREPKSGDDTGRLLVVWLTIPGLYRNLHRILRQLRFERADLEAEAVLAVLTTLETADPDHPDTGGRMIKAAVNRMWAHARRVTREVPLVDTARFTEARNATALPHEQPQLTEEWEVHITPPPRPDGLAATLRFAESRTRLEGERIGALAYHAGLPEVVLRARRHEEAELIGTLVLRPAGARR